MEVATVHRWIPLFAGALILMATPDRSVANGRLMVLAMLQPPAELPEVVASPPPDPRPESVEIAPSVAVASPTAPSAPATPTEFQSIPPALEIHYERVLVEITDHAVTTKVNQQFRNNTDRTLEGQFEFQLGP